MSSFISGTFQDVPGKVESFDRLLTAYRGKALKELVEIVACYQEIE